jgi:ubiquinone/menaquinone biosynthesis C-methylase UbiE
MSEAVQAHWDDRAADRTRDDVEVTHPDVWQRWLEIETIRPHLRADDRVLDVGCGSGYATRRFAPHVASIVGIDFSEPMIARAKAGDNPANLSFKVADVRRLSGAGLGTFDTAVSVRCLINILHRTEQFHALDEIARVIRPGGRLILVEGKAEGRAALNEAREAHGLDAMPPVWHNRDFREGELLAHLDRNFTVSFKRGFGRYDYISRVVHPHLIKPRAPEYTAEINQIAARIAVTDNDAEHLSRIIFLALERKWDDRPEPAQHYGHVRQDQQNIFAALVTECQFRYNHR